MFFPLSKGIRQGCPLSALLFLLVVETLAINVRNNINIKGIKCQDNEVKISLLADDTTIFMRDITSLQIAMNVMYMFKQSSGLKINKSKTKILQVGKKDWKVHYFKMQDVDKIYSLGTWFYKSTDEINAVNYEYKFKQFEGVLQRWKNRNLTVLERIKIVKTFALSKLHYVMSSLEIKKEFVEKVQRAIYEFIWKGSKPQIKNNVAQQKIEDGGLVIPNVDMYI